MTEVAVPRPVVTPAHETPQRRLDELKLGESGFVCGFELENDESRRLMELGFLPGGEVQYARRSPFGDPRVFRVDGCDVALRRETAHLIFIGGRPQAA